MLTIFPSISESRWGERPPPGPARYLAAIVVAGELTEARGVHLLTVHIADTDAEFRALCDQLYDGSDLEIKVVVYGWVGGALLVPVQSVRRVTTCPACQDELSAEAHKVALAVAMRALPILVDSLESAPRYVPFQLTPEEGQAYVV